jgi:hypothetical protein
MINYLSKKIKEVEKEMMDVLKSNQSMLNNYKLITSIKGIGNTDSSIYDSKYS